MPEVREVTARVRPMRRPHNPTSDPRRVVELRIKKAPIRLTPYEARKLAEQLLAALPAAEALVPYEPWEARS